MKAPIVVGLISALVVAALAGCASAPTVPGPLRVPAGQSLIKELHATGVQIYECQPAKGDASQFEWSFRSPEAVLSTKGGRNLVKHYGGPTWESNDGSRVVGEVVASSPATQPNSIAWLLLRAKSTSGNGLFAHVQFIQRLNTVGGSVPPGGCTRQQAGQQLRAAYTADYFFYGTKH